MAVRIPEGRAVGGPDGIGRCIAEKVLSPELFVISGTVAAINIAGPRDSSPRSFRSAYGSWSPT
jgi:hypothetical protein